MTLLMTDDVCPTAMPNHKFSLSVYIQSLKDYVYLLLLSSVNENCEWHLDRRMDRQTQTRTTFRCVHFRIFNFTRNILCIHFSLRRLCLISTPGLTRRHISICKACRSKKQLSIPVFLLSTNMMGFFFIPRSFH